MTKLAMEFSVFYHIANVCLKVSKCAILRIVFYQINFFKICQITAQIAIVMGSKSDWATMQEATQILDELNVAYHVEVVSAHRTPDKLFEFAENAQRMVTK